MMKTIEQQNIEYKSLQKIRTGDKGFNELAITCVAFANAQGGKIYIGYDDKKCAPLPNQVVTQEELNDATTRIKDRCCYVALSASEILAYETGSQYFIITVLPSMRSIATTSDGKIYIRLADKCTPVRSEDLQRLMEEKGMFQWELTRTKFEIDNDVKIKLNRLANRLRTSDRASEYLQQADDFEIAEIYHLIDDKYLTNLGVLWLGTPKQRGTICFDNSVQYLVYDTLDQKVRKQEWHEHLFAPDELLLEIEKTAIELTYSYEFPNGLFRKQIRHYHPKVVRELLVNAIAHKSYSISKDITIAVYPNRMEICSPGGLPLGVTANNILHERVRRNPNLIEILNLLHMMEGEGSGYDLIYELNATEVKQQPKIEDSFSEVCVTQYAEIVEPELLPLLDFVMKNYTLPQKALIAFGVIAKERKILSTELSSLLQLKSDDRLGSYINVLLSQNIVQKSGIKKGTQLFVNPQLIKNARLNRKTSLKEMEPYAIKALILEDLKMHPNSGLTAISTRIPDIDKKEIKKHIYELVEKHKIIPKGERRWTTYSIV